MLVQLDIHDRVVAVNQQYLDATQHRIEEVLGLSFWDDLLAVGSRVFYQTQLAPVLQLDHHLREIMVDLRTPTGRIPALLNATRHTDSDGRRATTDIALMTVTDRRAYESRLRDARDDAEYARRDAELAKLRLELLAQANTALATSLDVEVAVPTLARTLAGRLADWCTIHLADPEDADTAYTVAAHADPACQEHIERLADLLPVQLDPDSTLANAFQRDAASLVAEVIDQQQSFAHSDDVRMLCSKVGLASLIVAPAFARGRRVATITLGRAESGPRFTADDLADMTDLAARAGIVIDNLRRHAREHSNSIALQHALLTTPPKADGFDIVTRYLPATNGNDVGGDWYDALLLPDGTPMLAIGDVIGHDIHAAAAMGQLRGIIRTLAYTRPDTPAEILARADVTSAGLGVNVLATAVVACLRTTPAGDTELHWSNAGHPPPVLLTPSGVKVLHSEPNRLLGLPAELRRPRHNNTHTMHPGDILILYTDGLIERTDEELEDGITTLAQAMTSVAERSLDQLCDAILDARRGDTRDDVALLAVQVAG